MAVRTRCLAIGGWTNTGAFVAVYTVPSDRTAIVRHFSVHNQTAVARAFTVGVRRAGVFARIGGAVALAPSATWLHESDDLALDPGSTLEITVDNAAAGTLNVYVAGSLLEGVPT